MGQFLQRSAGSQQIDGCDFRLTERRPRCSLSRPTKRSEGMSASDISTDSHAEYRQARGRGTGDRDGVHRDRPAWILDRDRAWQCDGRLATLWDRPCRPCSCWDTAPGQASGWAHSSSTCYSSSFTTCWLPQQSSPRAASPPGQCSRHSWLRSSIDASSARRSRLDSPALLKFMTIAALSCLVAATVGVSSLAFSSAIVWTNYTDTWLTWWIGDLVGILTVAPVLLVVGYRSWQGQGSKYLTFPLISGVAGLAFFTGYNIWKLGDHAVAAYLGVSPAWLSWGMFGIGLLLAMLLAYHIEYYLGIEAALRESEERRRPSAPRIADPLPHRSDRACPGGPRSAISADQ